MAKAAVRAGLVAVGLAWALFAQVALAADAKTYVVDGSEAASLETCVESTDVMRRKHMEFIKHQRDDTVHGGIRGSKHSLAGCVSCHVSYDANHAPAPIHQRDEFCGACHAFTAVNLNCFDCHAAVPTGPGADLAAQGAYRSVGVEQSVHSRPDGEDH